MSLVSNFIGGISSSGLSGLNGLTQSFDLNDTTFFFFFSVGWILFP